MDQLIHLILQCLFVLVVAVAKGRNGNAGTHIKIFSACIVNEIHSFPFDKCYFTIVSMYKMLICFLNIHIHPPFCQFSIRSLHISRYLSVYIE